MSEHQNNNTDPERQPEHAPRGQVLALGGGVRTKPGDGFGYVTIVMPIADLRRVRLYANVELVAVKPEGEATP